LPSETMIWQPEFTDKTLSRKPGAVHNARLLVVPAVALIHYLNEMCQSTETAVNDAFCRTLTRESLAIP
ncbi:hypothetical protein MZE34_20660, partial [Escherichia coli]|nr:hypothetical protein [Escherichia coli]MCJ8435169.1 hypothetical protein [Escherichia coli]MCJ8453933.1 hypothetical protein [Escherichia coli]MCK2561702.1 hypothetical protein [Escherichia coli]